MQAWHQTCTGGRKGLSLPHQQPSEWHCPGPCAGAKKCWCLWDRGRNAGATLNIDTSASRCDTQGVYHICTLRKHSGTNFHGDWSKEMRSIWISPAFQYLWSRVLHLEQLWAWVPFQLRTYRNEATTKQSERWPPHHWTSSVSDASAFIPPQPAHISCYWSFLLLLRRKHLVPSQVSIKAIWYLAEVSVSFT